MAHLRDHAVDRRGAVLAGELRTRLSEVIALAEKSQDTSATRETVHRYVKISSHFMNHLDAACGRSRSKSVRAADALYSEQEGHHGVNTFTNYHNASGVGTPIGAGAWVQVSCKVYDPYIQSVNPDGYWYRIASSPWNNAYYSPANTFMNGDPWNGPYTHNTDFSVPNCGAPPPAPAPTATLAQGPAAPSGYRYAITVDHFAANSSVSVSCRDSVDPAGFYTFSLPTDSSGHGFTQSYCYSGDGPDHWAVINGTVESNHVSWSGGSGGGSSSGSGSGGGSSGGAGNSAGGGGSGGQTTKPIGGTSDKCETYQGSRIADSGSVAGSLFGHYLTGHGDPVVIDWSFFSRNGSFVNEAKSLQIGHLVSGWTAPWNTDMYFALGHFTIERDTADCFLVYDHYDFDWDTAKKYVVFFPLWAIQIAGAKEFEEHASGKL